jgi:hypothetical protein
MLAELTYSDNGGLFDYARNDPSSYGHFIIDIAARLNCSAKLTDRQAEGAENVLAYVWRRLIDEEESRVHEEWRQAMIEEDPIRAVLLGLAQGFRAILEGVMTEVFDVPASDRYPVDRVGMLVSLDDGMCLRGTQPKSLRDVPVGTRVSFEALLRYADKEHPVVYYSYPRRVKVLAEALLS